MLHGDELILPEKEGRAYQAGQGQGRGGNVYFINKGIVTTDDIDAWFAERQASVREGRVGEQYQLSSEVEAGIDL